MRTHRAIVQEHGAAALGRDLATRGILLTKSAPQRWADRDSIPGEYWAPLADMKVATLEELAAAAARQPEQAAA